MTANDGDGMEIRKLQLTGGSSIAITLPKKWIERSHLHAGDAVGCVVRQDGSLLVTPRAGRKRAPQTLEIEIAGEKSEHLFRLLVGAYLNGYEIIRLHSKKALDTGAREVVRKAAKRAMGLEIVDESPNDVTLQDFLDPTEFPLERGLRRMAAMCQLMHQDAWSQVKTGLAKEDAGMEERDSEVDRLYWLVNKQFHRLLRDAQLADKMQMTPNQALNFLLVARLVERTADHAKRISDNAAELHGEPLPAALLKQVDRMADEAHAIFKDGIAAFFKKDSRAANACIDRAGDVHAAKRKLVHEVMEMRGTALPAVALAYILESLERTASYGADVAETAINHVVANKES